MAEAAENKEKNEEEFTINRYEKLNQKAVYQAMKKSGDAPVWLAGKTDKELRQQIKGMQGFDHRVVNLMNKWASSKNQEKELEMVTIEGKKAIDYMEEKGCSFLDCMVVAQTAIERNKPAVEFDFPVTGKQQRFEQRMNLSDPSLQNVPPSHMPNLLNQVLKTVTFGFFENRAERQNHRKELEIIRLSAVERERQSRLKDDDKSAYAREVADRKEKNRARAEQLKKVREEEKLSLSDTRHSTKGKENLKLLRENGPLALESLEKRNVEYTEQRKEIVRQMKEKMFSTYETKRMMEENPQWKKDPQMRGEMKQRIADMKGFETLHKQLREVNRAKREMRTTMQKLTEVIDKSDRLEELYQMQGEHKLTPQLREEMMQIERSNAPSEKEIKKDVSERKRVQEIERKIAARKAKEAEKQAQKENPVKEKKEKEMAAGKGLG